MTESDQFNDTQRYGTVMVNRPALHAWLLSWTNASSSPVEPRFVTAGHTTVKDTRRLRLGKLRRPQKENL